MNHKAIVLDFVIVILIALIIFGSSSYIIAKMFNTKAQAEDSFKKFAEELEDFANQAATGEEKIFILVMDTGSSVLKLDPGNSVHYSSGETFIYPEESCDGKTCLILCDDNACNSPLFRKLSASSLSSSDFYIRRSDGQDRRIIVHFVKGNSRIDFFFQGGYSQVRPAEQTYVNDQWVPTATINPNPPFQPLIVPEEGATALPSDEVPEEVRDLYTENTEETTIAPDCDQDSEPDDSDFCPCDPQKQWLNEGESCDNSAAAACNNNCEHWSANYN